MTISDSQRAETEARIRTATDRLLSGAVPPGGRCDIKTLAAEANVSRAALYRTYPHLKDQFVLRLSRVRAQGHLPDPRDAQIARLKEEITKLRKRISELDERAAAFSVFETTAISRLAAQHDELRRLQQLAARPSNLVTLPSAGLSEKF